MESGRGDFIISLRSVFLKKGNQQKFSLLSLILFSIIFLIDIYDESFKKTLTNFISFNTSEIFKQAIKILFLYSGLTLIIFIVLNIFSIRAFDSLNLAFTLISSGGFLPVNDLSSILKNNYQIIIFSLLMLLSFFSIFFIFFLFFC